MNIPMIDMRYLVKHAKATIKHRGNMFLVGPRGTGKSDGCATASFELCYNTIKVNLSTYERSDFAGVVNFFSDLKNITSGDVSKSTLNRIKQYLSKIPKTTAFADFDFNEFEKLFDTNIKSGIEYMDFKYPIWFKPMLEGSKLEDYIENIVFHNPKPTKITNFEESVLVRAANWISNTQHIVSHYEIVGPKIQTDLVKHWMKDLKATSKISYRVENTPFVQFRVKESEIVEQVLILDEADKAKEETQDPLLSMTQERRVNDARFNWLRAIFLTGNMLYEGNNCKKPLEPLLSRCEVLVVHPSLAAYEEYSNSYKRQHPAVLSFVKSNSNVLFGALEASEAWQTGTPRNMDKVSDLRNITDSELKEYPGNIAETEAIFYEKSEAIIGRQNGMLFRVHCQHYMEFLPHIDPMFDAANIGDHEAAVEAAKSLNRFFRSKKVVLSQIYVCLFTIMNKYTSSIEVLSSQFSRIGEKYSKLSKEQKLEVEKLALKTTSLIDAVGTFLNQATKDKNVVSQENQSVNSAIVNGDLMISLLRNSISSNAKWKKFIGGDVYSTYIEDWLEDHQKEFEKSRPYYFYDYYTDKSETREKLGLLSPDTPYISYALFDHPIWIDVITSAHHKLDELKKQIAAHKK